MEDLAAELCGKVWPKGLCNRPLRGLPSLGFS